MNRLVTLLNNLYLSQWRETLLTILSIILGVFAGPIVERIAPPLFQAANLPFIIYILIASLFLISATLSLTMWRTTNQQITSVKNHADALANAIGQRIQILPYAKGYKELQKRFQNAKTEILLLSNYVFDWEGQKPIYDPDRLQSLERKAAYAASQAKLKREKRNGFRYLKIIQIPKGHRLEVALPYDAIYDEDCRFIVNISKTEPEFASLRVSEITFQNSFCIIDRSFLYMEFDIRKAETNQVFSPFVMIVEDPNSEIVQVLVKLHQRIEASSTLITHLD